jgi:hypothetical protein
MNMLLRSMAACDVDLIANRASLLGVEIESLSVEARGHFNVQRSQLRRACEEASPVDETLQRSVPLSLELEDS